MREKMNRPNGDLVIVSIRTNPDERVSRKEARMIKRENLRVKGNLTFWEEAQVLCFRGVFELVDEETGKPLGTWSMELSRDNREDKILSYESEEARELIEEWLERADTEFCSWEMDLLISEGLVKEWPYADYYIG